MAWNVKESRSSFHYDNGQGHKKGAGHYSRDYVKFSNPMDTKAPKKLGGFEGAKYDKTGPVSHD